MLSLSIIILSFRSKTDLAILLPSIFESENISFSSQDSSQSLYLAETIVVDNGSEDGTVKWLEAEIGQKYSNQQICLIQNANTGFAHGNNLGIKQAKGKYILLLNPDTKLETNTLYEMLKFMDENLEVGISGCKLIKKNGELDIACRRRFPNPSNAFQRLFLGNNINYNYTDIDENLSMQVESVVGAFLLIRKSVIEKIGLLDEEFFMYGEDLDWCWRCYETGFKVWYYPKVTCFHYKGSSSRKIPNLALKWFHEAMWIFYTKHYAKNHARIFNLTIFLGIRLRLLTLQVVNFFKSDVVVSK